MRYDHVVSYTYTSRKDNSLIEPIGTGADYGQYNSWLEVNISALRANAALTVAQLKSSTENPAQLMAVVKADGYGHGTLNAAKAFREGGATWFGVTSLLEALELVSGGIDSEVTPILVFAPLVTEEQVLAAAAKGLHLTVCDLEHIRLLSKVAEHRGTVVLVHLKVDTGMSRLGLLPEAAIDVALEITKDPYLRLVGVYTHFATANEKNLTHTKVQLRKFNQFTALLSTITSDDFIRHAANSSALLRLPESRLDLVRAGTILYGQRPSLYVPKNPNLRTDTWNLKSRVIFVHELPAGVRIGYGAETETKRPTVAAVLAIGYADGVAMQPTSLSSGFRGIKALAISLVMNRPLTVKIGDFRAPVLGRIAMQMMVVDVTDSPVPVANGDIATVPARRLAVRSTIPKFAVTDSIGP